MTKDKITIRYSQTNKLSTKIRTRQSVNTEDSQLKTAD